MNEEQKKELSRNATILPPAWIDRRILKRIRRRPVLRPFLAGSVAVAVLITMVLWLTALYTGSGLSLEPILAAIYTALAYLAICTVATLPLMMFPERFGWDGKEVKETI